MLIPVISTYRTICFDEAISVKTTCTTAEHGIRVLVSLFGGARVSASFFDFRSLVTANASHNNVLSPTMLLGRP